MSTLNGKKPKTFKSMLAGLTCEKHKIGHLTQQARADLAHEETLAEVDVNAITSFIVNKNADDRLAGLYLIDSICQNVAGKYVPLFEEHIFPLIETTYRYGSSQTRKTLCKILNIWKSRKIFPIEILRNIYKAISNQQQNPSTPPSIKSSSITKPNNNNNNNNNRNNHNHNHNTMYNQQLPYNPSYNQQHPPTAAYYHAPHQPPPSYYHPHHQQATNGPPPPSYYQPPPQQQPPYYHPAQAQAQTPTQPMNGWQTMCLKYNISSIEYESVITDLISSISNFIKSPYSYHNGIFVETPQLKNANWTCPKQIISEFNKCVNEFNEYQVDITRKLYFICTELKHQGCNTWLWQNKLSKISPFIDSHSHSHSYGNHNDNKSGPNISICEFYNSVDGCRSGSNCQYLHVTGFEAEVRRKLLEKVENRYQYKDIKFIDECSDLKITTFYTYFGTKEELKKKHGRSISLLYSKKLKICPNCSLRITADSFSKHMKWHFHRRNSILMKKRQSGFKSQQYGMYRNWYKSSATWITTTDTNLADNKLLNDEINPFQSIQTPTQPIMNMNMNMNMNMKEKKDKHINDNNLYRESQVLLNGISQIVICAICEEEFAKTNKEYNAQKDDWILKNACYSDGSTSNSKENKNNIKNLAIVHRKCYELKKKQSLSFDKELKPKLYNKNNTLSKIEDQINTHSLSIISTSNKRIKKSKKLNRKRKINHLFAASDDEDIDDDDDEDEEEVVGNNNNNNNNSNDNDIEMENIRKKRKLNNGTQNIKSGKEENNNNNNNNNNVKSDKNIEEEEDDDYEEDDLAGMGIDDIDQQQTKTITISYNNNKTAKEEKKEETKMEIEIETETEREEMDTQQHKQENNNNNNDNDENNNNDLDNLDNLDDVELDDEELADIDVDVDVDDDDEDEADIVLFDPNAYNEAYQRPYGYRGY